MKTITECNLCGGKIFKFLFKNHDRVHGIPEEFSLLQCRCGLVFIDPQPNENEMARYYPEDYGPHSIEEDDSITGKFKQKLEQVFYNPNCSRVLQRFLLSPFRPLLRGVVIKPNASLLDFGCGSGSFLEKMKRYGMNVYGVDFSKIAVSKAEAKGLNVFCGYLEEAHFPDETFDVITLNHVFEHLHDPFGTLRELGRILKKDGTIVIGVPSIRSLGFKVFGKYWMPLETPRHLFLYSFMILKDYAERLEFKVVKKTYQSFPWFTLISFDFWLNQFRKNKVLGQGSWLSTNLILRLGLFPLSVLLSWTPWADNVEVWLRKE